MKIKVIILIAAALIGCCNLVFGQKKKKRPEKVESPSNIGDQTSISEYNSNPRAYIELEDGSQFLGNIISDDKEVIELEIIDNNIISLKHGYIASILKEGDNISFTKKGRYNYNKGFFVNIMPLGLGVNIETGGTFTSQLVGGYQLNKRLGVGVGMGFEYHSTRISGNWLDFWILPTYAYAKYNLNLVGPRVYALGKLGGAKRLNSWWNNDEINTSLHTALGLGIAFPTRGAGRFVMELSNSMVLVNGSLFSWDQFGNPITQDFRSFISRSSLKIGIGIGQ